MTDLIQTRRVTMPRPRNASLLAWCAGGTLSLSCTLSMAQPDAPATDPAAAQTSAQTADAGAVLGQARALLKDYTARAIVRLGVMDLRLRPDPSPDDYRIAALTMGLSAGVQTPDAEVLRRIADASWNATDEQAAIDATARLVQVDPADRVAILRVVSATIARMQTAEERLAAYDRLLGPGGARLPATVRSRLALDHALLLRERGDEDGFVDRLKMATSLDATNKEAALLASALFNERSTDPMGRLEMLTNLLYADPMDPSVHAQISASLAQAGAFTGAKRLWTNAETLLNLSGPDRQFEGESRRLVHQWLATGPSDLVLSLNKRLAAQREVKGRQIEAQTAAGGSLTDIGKVEDARLPVPLDRIRVLAAIAAGDRITYETGCVDMSRSAAALLKESRDPQIELMMPREEAEDFAKRALITAELIAAIAGVTSPELEENLATLAELGAAQDPRLMVAAIARNLEKSGVTEAVTQLTVLDFSSDPTGEAEAAASVVAAEALKKQNKREQAATLLRACARKHTLLPMGALAWSRYQQIKGPSDTLTPQAAAMESFAESIPRWIDQAITDPRSMMAMEAKLEKTTISGLQRPLIHLRLRNVCPIPLSLGPDRTINSRIIFAPRIDVGQGGIGQYAQPEIVEADRRLRLEPNETLEIDVTPDLGFTGWLGEVMCSDVARMRWRVLQGFRSSEQGVIEAGPGCLTTETGTVVRNPIAESTLDPTEIPTRVANRDEAELLPLAVLLRARVIAIGMLPEADAERPNLIAATTEVINAFAARYPTLSPLGRMMLACVLPHARQLAEMEAFDRVALQDQDPRVLALQLVSRCADAELPTLVAACESSDPTLREIATRHRARLATPDVCFARVGPSLSDFNPPAETAP